MSFRVQQEGCLCQPISRICQRCRDYQRGADAARNSIAIRIDAAHSRLSDIEDAPHVDRILTGAFCDLAAAIRRKEDGGP